MEPLRLLIVEDDLSIGRNLERALTSSGYSTVWAASARAAEQIADRPDLILLDLGLPDGDGLDLVRTFSERWAGLPIIILTARADEMDIVIGLDSGAVDYVTKPFRLAELLARVRAHLRWDSSDVVDQIIDGNLEVNVEARRVVLDGAEVALRAKEYDLLLELLTHRGKVVTRGDLMANVWDEHWFGSTKTLDVHIAALRRRLGEGPGEASRITSLRGIGYRWEPAETGT